ncbi:MAG: hypothetical protein JO309_14640 [Pseudonocardiales bacterium]|nr:hypothetical protein [Pseudonocardiales bacterium]MBV9730610.1 hypothetical protein [Pseudonocardiales bacterium]
MEALAAAVTRLVQARLAAAFARMAATLWPSLAEFDLVRDLTGWGAYLLRRAPHGWPAAFQHTSRDLADLPQQSPCERDEAPPSRAPSAGPHRYGADRSSTVGEGRGPMRARCPELTSRAAGGRSDDADVELGARGALGATRAVARCG